MTECRQGELFHKKEFDIAANYSQEATVTLFHGDRLSLLHQIAESGSKAELIVTSPPYNLGKEYEETTSLSRYVAQQRETIAACFEILSPTGSICWQVGNYIEGSSRSIASKYSHLNGEEWLLVHETECYEEIQRVIHSIDAEECRTKISRERGRKGEALYSPRALNGQFEKGQTHC